MSRADFTERDTIRRNFAVDLIVGRGVEIGAGAYPQVLPPGAAAAQYDLRDAAELEALFGTETTPVRPLAELRSDFPAGADFLIAHNVLEHAPDPIGELTRWNRCVRDGGVVLLSLPHYLYCPDARRTVPPLSHLIDDYLTATDGRDFASREHVASFLLGWWRDFCRNEKISSTEEFSRLALEKMRSDQPDLHWHAFDSDVAIQTAMSAASLSGTEIEMLRCWRPELGQSIGDILIAYRIVRRSEPGENFKALIRLHRQRQDAVKESLGLIGSRVRGFVEMLDAASPRLRVFPLLRPFLQEGDFCFVTPTPAQLSTYLESRTEITLMEDSRPLGPPDSLHQLIRDQGGGAFSVWGSSIYFSSSDRSDCNTNGRRYALAAVAGSNS